jgi:succinyl-CoA synthetase beta subunit
MKLFEYQAMDLLRGKGLSTNNGEVANTPDEAFAIASRFEGTVVVKAQVLTGGRGKAGGVKLVRTPEEARKIAAQILGMTIKGNTVRKLLVARALDIERELYVSVLVDSGEKCIDLIASAEGGMEIEEVARVSPEKIIRLRISNEILSDKKSIMTFLRDKFPGVSADQFASIIGKLYSLFIEFDCSLVEINPLAMDRAGNLVALDAKIVIDDNALYRHPELEALRNPEEYSADEIEARKASLAFVSLDGNIGCMVNGAGLAMATMDLIKHYGGAPANFLDIGGSSNPQKVVDGLSILRRNPGIKAILLNIFGGITRCDDIATGFLEAEKQFHIGVPIVIRLIGTNDTQGIRMLRENGFSAYSGLSDAVKAVVAESGQSMKTNE